MHSTLSPIDKVYLSIIQMSFFGKSLTIIQSCFSTFIDCGALLVYPVGPLELDPLPIYMILTIGTCRLLCRPTGVM